VVQAEKGGTKNYYIAANEWIEPTQLLVPPKKVVQGIFYRDRIVNKRINEAINTV